MIIMARSAAAAAAALHIIISCMIIRASLALPRSLPVAATASAFVAPSDIVGSRHVVTSSSRASPRSAREAANTAADAPSTTTATASPQFHIREAKYPDLSHAAELMTDGFYPELRGNPVLRPLRYFLELERLQGNFPYDEDDRHFYLAACNANGEVIGFCDVDGRIPKGRANNGGMASLLPFVKYIQRPQPYFSDLAVRPDHRRKGVASALMEEADIRARRMGFEELYLGVRSTNELALRMYSGMGYESIVPSGDMLAFLEIQKDVRMLRRSLDVDSRAGANGRG